MALEITISSILSFIAITLLLLIYTGFDLRTRHVPNRIMIIGGSVGMAIVILTGHLFEHVLLHVSSGIFMIIVAYMLFRVGAFGGADVKAVTTIAILSPGIEFGGWSDPILEGIVASGLLLAIVLVCAYIYSKYKRKRLGVDVIPLLPIMLVAYLVLQLLALV
ncbi:MAG: prepilin peptidase [Candidatus Thorarchaeota archaeon]|nr:prepilin peptidase [Candidatus Thorarchaeota archaeon]